MVLKAGRNGTLEDELGLGHLYNVSWLERIGGDGLIVKHEARARAEVDDKGHVRLDFDLAVPPRQVGVRL